VANLQLSFHNPAGVVLARYVRIMPRRAPIDPHGYYHVTTKGNFGQPLFETREHHELYLALYDRAARKLGWVTLAWTLLWNHHHFLIKLTDGGLSEGMGVINRSFSRRMNELSGMTGSGHLVRHGFYAGLVETDAHLLAACRYIDLNAVTARREDSAEQWPWSGYRAAIGLEHPRPFHQVSALLQLFGPNPNVARRSYRRFVEEGRDPGRRGSSPGDGDEPRT
jgi:REP element-mobilizing transposase RayT